MLPALQAARGNVSESSLCAKEPRPKTPARTATISEHTNTYHDISQAEPPDDSVEVFPTEARIRQQAALKEIIVRAKESWMAVPAPK